MYVNKLIENLKKKDFNLEKALEVKKYLPIEVKKTIAQGIIYECTDDDEGAIKVDSVQRYMAYVRYMITTHTNLVYTDEDYDVLCSTEYEGGSLLDVIMSYFGDDAKECSRILNLMMDDYMQTATLEFTVAKFLYGLNTALGTLLDGINQKVDGIDVKGIVNDIVVAQFNK